MKNRPEFPQGWQTAVMKQHFTTIMTVTVGSVPRLTPGDMAEGIYANSCERWLRLVLGRASGKCDQVGADGLLPESPNTNLNFYKYFRSVVLGHYCYLKFIFTLIHF